MLHCLGYTCVTHVIYSYDAFRTMANTTGCSTVASRLDYCNLLLCGTPSTTLDSLQGSQGVLARVVTHCTTRTIAKSSLQSLHWLPDRERIKYKVTSLTFKSRRTSTSVYLHSLLNDYAALRSLPSSSTPQLIVPRTRIEQLPNARSLSSLPLPETICLMMFLMKKHLKT